MWMKTWYHGTYWPPGWFPEVGGDISPRGKGKGSGGKGKKLLIAHADLLDREKSLGQERLVAEMRTRELAQRVVRHRVEYEMKLLEMRRRTQASIWCAVLGEV